MMARTWGTVHFLWISHWCVFWGSRTADVATSFCSWAHIQLQLSNPCGLSGGACLGSAAASKPRGPLAKLCSMTPWPCGGISARVAPRACLELLSRLWGLEAAPFCPPSGRIGAQEQGMGCFFVRQDGRQAGKSGPGSESSELGEPEGPILSAQSSYATGPNGPPQHSPSLHVCARHV